MRNKLIGILGVCSLAPLLIGLILLFYAGERHYVAQKGELFATVSQNIADALEYSLKEQIDNLHAWVAFSALTGLAGERIGNPAAPLTDDMMRQAESLEKQWLSLQPDDPALREYLDNPVALALKRFQIRYPLYAEILLTDMAGRLVAATNKTSDFWQADENWWVMASHMQSQGVWVEGIHFDESANVYSFDVSMPLPASGGQPGSPIGVIKGVVDVTPLFASLREIQAVSGAASQLVMRDGLVLTRLFGKAGGSMQDMVSAEVIGRMSAEGTGWMVETFSQNQKDLIGFSSLDFSTPVPTDLRLRGIDPLFVAVYDKAAVVLAPFRRQLLILAGLGGGGILLFMSLGLYFVDRRIVIPLKRLHQAARLIERSAGLPGEGQEKYGLRETDLHQAALDSIGRVEEIDTHDEIKQLADAFGQMGRQVLNYHVQLEEELQLKTEEIESDLRIAREFQEALIRTRLPEFSAGAAAKGIGLRFSHIYKPASSIGGDFFVVNKISDSHASILIADVMGHGIRAALIASVLRTLFLAAWRESYSPAQALTLVNRYFLNVLPRENAVLFATAAHLEIDLHAGKSTFASAGHLSPLIADRSTGTVASLLPDSDIGPALGLFEDTAYVEGSLELNGEQTFILFTDGATEAANPDGNEFGEQRLKAVVQDNLGKRSDELNKTLLNSLRDFMRTTVSIDDICILTADVFKN